MSYVFDFDAASGILRTRFQGKVDDQEIKNYFTVVREIVAKISMKGALLDYSGVTTYAVSPAAIRAFAASRPTVSDPKFPILVIASRAHIFGATRMFQMLSNENRPGLKIVKTEKEALEALGLRNPQFRPLDLE